MDHQIGNPAQLAVELMIEGAAAGVTEEKSHSPTTSDETMASMAALSAVETFYIPVITAWSERMRPCNL